MNIFEHRAWMDDDEEYCSFCFLYFCWLFCVGTIGYHQWRKQKFLWIVVILRWMKMSKGSDV